MKMTALRLGLLLVWLLTNPLSLVRAQQDETIYDKDVKVVEYEDMKYPPIAETAHIEGVVVVRVKLDREGKVVDAMAASGNALLKRPCLDNAKKWKFDPNPQNAAILVYNFRLIMYPALCSPEGTSLFILYPPNFASVTGCGGGPMDSK